MTVSPTLVANNAEVPSYSSATVSVEVAPVNDGPTTVADFGTVVSTAGTSVRVLSNDNDIDLDTLTITQIVFEGKTVAISGETTVTGGETGSVGRESNDWYH